MRMSPSSGADEAYRTAFGMIDAYLRNDGSTLRKLWNDSDDDLRWDVALALTNIASHLVEAISLSNDESTGEVIDRLRGTL
jgi:hypothetical protein